MKVGYDPLELLELLKRDFNHMNLVCERAGLFDPYIEARTDALLAFFGLSTGEHPQGER